jgi:hypothetical protein
MGGVNWLKAVRDADTFEGLLRVVNEYLLQQPEEYWSWIPKESRPSLVASLAELDHWHQKLSREVSAIQSPNIRLQDLCVFFVRAWARAVELGEPRPVRPSNDREFQCVASPPSRKRTR